MEQALRGFWRSGNPVLLAELTWWQKGGRSRHVRLCLCVPGAPALPPVSVHPHLSSAYLDHLYVWVYSTVCLCRHVCVCICTPLTPVPASTPAPVYPHAHLYIYTHLYVSTHTCMSARTSVCPHAHLYHLYLYIHLHLSLSTRTPVCLHAHLSVCMHICMSTHTPVCLHAHLYHLCLPAPTPACIHTYLCVTYIHIHICVYPAIGFAVGFP